MCWSMLTRCRIAGDHKDSSVKNESAEKKGKDGERAVTITNEVQAHTQATAWSSLPKMEDPNLISSHTRSTLLFQFMDSLLPSAAHSRQSNLCNSLFMLGYLRINSKHTKASIVPLRHPQLPALSPVERPSLKSGCARPAGRQSLTA